MIPVKQTAAVWTALVMFSGCAAQSAVQTPSDTLNAYFFEAGKADAVLLYTDESAVLIDTGEAGYGSEILSYMKEHGIESLDCLIITHFDKDHVGGAAQILDNTKVSRVLVSNSPKDSDEYTAFVRSLEMNDLSAEVITGTDEEVFEIDGVLYSVDGPDEEEYDKDPSNNSSLITSVTYGSNSILLTGDAENDRIKEYLIAHSGDYDVLKVPYHGNYLKQLAKLVDAVTPETAVITCSEDEGGEEKTAAVLAAEDIETYYTYNGGVTVTSDGKDITVSQ